MKRSFHELANRVTGFEVPVFGGGLSWNPPVLDIEVARQLITFLEDRRALYRPYDQETSRFVTRSIVDIRERLTQDLEQLDRTSPLAKSLSAMRTACRLFVDKTERLEVDFYAYRPHRWDTEERAFFMALGELRAVMGIHAAQISVRYGIDVEEDLVSIFPPKQDVP